MASSADIGLIGLAVMVSPHDPSQTTLTTSTFFLPILSHVVSSFYTTPIVSYRART